MALARGTIIKPVDFNLPVLQFPSELAFQQAVGFQSEKDMYDALAQTTPKARSIDEPWRQEYTKYVQDLSETVTQAFATGNTDLAMKALRKAKTNVQDMWRPGGLASALEEAYTTEALEIQKLQESHASDPTGAGNLVFALKRFKQGQQPLNYDYDTGKYNRVGQAEMYNYVDIPDELINLAKEVDPDLTEQDFVDGSWITKIKTKEVPADRLQALWDGFVSRPEVASQLEISLYNQYGIDFNDIDVDFRKLDWANLTPDDAAKVGFIQQQIGAVTEVTDKTKKVYSEMSAEDKQRHLKAMGFYKGNIDGEFGKLSTEAEQRYMKYLDDNLAKDVTRLQTNPKSYFLEEVAAGPHRQTFYNLFGREYSKTLEANPYGLENVKYQHRLNLQSNLYNLQNQYNQETYTNATVTPSIASSFSTTIQDLTGKAKTMEDNGKKMLAALLKSPSMQEVLGFIPQGKDAASTMGQLYKIYEMARSSENPEAVFAAEVGKLGYTSRLGATPEGLYKAIDNKSVDIKESIRLIEDGRYEAEQLGQLEASVITETGVADNVYDAIVKNKANINFSGFDTWAGLGQQVYDIKLPANTTKQEFIAMVNKAASMTPEQLAKDPVLKVFLRTEIPGKLRGSVNPNMAVSIQESLRKDAQTVINEKGLPKSAVTFNLTSPDKRAAIGKANDALTVAFANNKLGFVDALTGNNTKWTRVDGKGVPKVADIKLEGAKVSLTTMLGKPLLQVQTVEDGVFQLEIPKEGNARKIVESAVQEEIAIALNKGAKDDLMLFAGIARQLNMTEADLGYSIIEVDNYNGVDPETNPVRNVKGIPVSDVYTPVKTVSMSDRMGNEYNFDVITWGEGNLQRWGIAVNNTLMGPIQIANTETGIGVSFDNNRSIGESSYASFNDVLNALEAVNQGMNIPVEQIMEKLPKGAQGSGFSAGYSESISGPRSLVEEMLGIDYE